MPLCAIAVIDKATQSAAVSIFFIYFVISKNINSAKLLKKNDNIEILYTILIFNKVSLRYHSFSLPLQNK